MKKNVVKIIKYVVLTFLMLGILALIINFAVILFSKNRIKSVDADFEKADCILVLGAGVWDDRPSHMLADRLDTAIELYKKGAAPKLIMSGDHGRTEYDEVNIMKAYAIEKGVASQDIFMDHAGFSTYDSIYRAKAVFETDNIIIVTQQYHLYRALHIASALDIDAVGVGADPRIYVGATYREMREIAARDKDFIKCIFKPKPTYLGNIISVSGDGNITNDKYSDKYFKVGE